MEANMSNTDRTVRTFIAIALIAFAMRGTLEGVWGFAAYVVAAIFLLTSLVSFCPIYTALGISTCSKRMNE